MKNRRGASTSIESCMTEFPFIATRNMPVDEAWEFMRVNGFRHMPVIEDDRIVGVVSDRDLRQARVLADRIPLFVSDVMTPDPYCVKIGTPLATIAGAMAQNKYGCTVVLNDWNRVVGIFTTTDAMKILSELLQSGSSSELKTIGSDFFLHASPGMNG